jgi:acetyl-CoA carboxylase biotin carboxyl carrier protein
MEAGDYLQQEFSALLDALAASDVEELELQRGELSIRLHRVLAPHSGEAAPSRQPEDAVSDGEAATVAVRSTLVGTFYRAGTSGEAPLVVEGSQVKDDTVIGIIEALGALTEVPSGYRGTVVRVLATDGHVVEYGQPLIEVALDG